MRKWLNLAELGFERWGRWVTRRPWWTLGVFMLLFMALLTQLPKLQLDTSTEGFFRQDDPVLIEYERFKERFGSDKAVVLMIRPDDVFSPETLKALTSLHRELEKELPYLDEVVSLVNVTSVRGEAEKLIVEDLLKDSPETSEARQELRARVLSNPIYRDQLISEDGRLTAMVIRPTVMVLDELELASQAELLDFATNDQSVTEDLTDFDENSPSATADALLDFDEEPQQATNAHELTLEEESRLMAVLKSITGRYQSENFQIYLGGMIVMETTILASMLENMPRFTITALILIAVLLALVFRRISGVILPLLTVVIALLSTVGLMAATGTPFTIISQILPSFLLAVSIGYSVHLLTIFYQQLQIGNSRQESIVEALGHSGLAVLITSLTTAGGLVSFAGVGLAPVGDLGRFGAIGVLIAVLFTLAPLPALLTILPIQANQKSEASKTQQDSLMVHFGVFSLYNPWKVLLVSGAVLGVSFFSALQLEFDHNPIAWMPEGHDLRVSNEAINTEMKGASVAEVVVRTSEENALKSWEWMNALDQFNREAEATKVGALAVGKSTSMADTLKQIHQALNENRADFYTIPKDPELIAQELLLFENSGGDDLERQVNPLYTTARITVKMPWLNANQYAPVLQELRNKGTQIFGGLGEFHLTGMVVLLAETMVLMIDSMLQSYLVAGLVITLLMILVLGRLRLGLISMIPNFLPIVLGLGVMHWVGLPLDLMSILVGSIALGLAVDDTIHFFHNFQRYFQETGDPEEAVRRTLNTTGRAMLFTSIVLSIGFFSYTISEMNNLFSFGLITGLTILFAFLADLLVAPALMGLLHPKK
ncbi:MAG: efflux RND transporter permease subunit [Deltaproteobacteria bacterium]